MTISRSVPKLTSYMISNVGAKLSRSIASASRRSRLVSRRHTKEPPPLLRAASHDVLGLSLEEDGYCRAEKNVIYRC